jgi:hypothetical protein
MDLVYPYASSACRLTLQLGISVVQWKGDPEKSLEGWGSKRMYTSE